MLRIFQRPNSILRLITTATFFSRLHLSSTNGDPETPTWVSTNLIFQRHPRLLSLSNPNQSLPRLLPILAYAIVSGLFRNPFVSSRVLLSSISLSPQNLQFAALVFAHVEKPNLFSWNTIIRAFAASDEHYLSAFRLFDEMLQTGARPDKFTFPFLLKACRSCDELRWGKLVHGRAFVLGFDSDPFVQTALVGMYLSCGSPAGSRRLFDEMTERDIVAWTAMISGLGGHGLHKEALEVFNEIRSCAANVVPNVATVVSTMSACANLGSLEHAKSLHAYVEKVGLERDVFVRNSLIDTYAKCGSLASSAAMFHMMSEKDLHSWTAMMTGLASHGFGKEALEIFSCMQKTGTMPDSTTFVAILSACSHAGLVNEGIIIFQSMERVYKVTPDIKHYGCMVDLFSRAGLLSRAYEFIISMTLEPNLAILGALLSSCSVYSDLEVGELVIEKIESSCQYKGGADVLLSNIYANWSQWHEVVFTRERGQRKASKPPGQSWIEVRGAIHEFAVGDRSHPLSTEIHLLLDGLGKFM
ncbi:pentatricopeptide repeat-containing protein At4g21065-like isoform X1 [Typha angustifolia]|uniref:pentatricopeptide repeat-containing protein At4g21065-like isoform X1 n=1 Tax=Typha angustifolia TaxID=59011 RepID=UPI003C2DA475